MVLLIIQTYYHTADCSRFASSSLGSDYSITEGRSFTDSSIHSLSSPEAASSPKPSPAKCINTPNKHIRVLNINFQNVRNKDRNVDVLVESTEPDKIIWTQTCLSEYSPPTCIFSTLLLNSRSNDVTSQMIHKAMNSKLSRMKLKWLM